MSQQLEGVLRKNWYNEAAGKEDFMGMVNRFIENSKIYLSKHLNIIIGLKDSSTAEMNIFPVIIILILFLITFYFAFKYDKIMLFIGIYLGGAIVVTFIVLQQSWAQTRMIIIYVPLMLLFFSWGIYKLSHIKGLKIIQLGMLLFLIIIFFKTLGVTIEKVKQNKKILAKNLKGNLYYGFTPDWTNFLKMSEWVGKNLPDSVVIASRKPSMSFIYSKGKEFYGLAKVPM